MFRSISITCSVNAEELAPFQWLGLTSAVSCCLVLFFRTHHSLGQLVVGFFVFFSCFLILVLLSISLVFSLSRWKKKAKKKSRTLNNNLTSICFVFKDGADHPWPLNCLSASLHWRPWKWSIVLLNLLKVLSAAFRPTLWWHRWGCGQNFNRVKWKPN